MAAVNGHTDAIKELIKYITKQDIMIANNNTNNALICASRGNHLNVVKILVKYIIYTIYISS